ncbi:hypothetical protein OBBRIDRAFT_797282 [Obba rivulosa]|uniref:F-box domain-containing protein n=1 Tax=Obba rivulosa TaxID=1052685 RepID=A0A8E2DGU7_9APHY|nr:hypothetical protein OBBRIDRAFT_797282 [Obba rivulosa]
MAQDKSSCSSNVSPHTVDSILDDMAPQEVAQMLWRKAQKTGVCATLELPHNFNQPTPELSSRTQNVFNSMPPIHKIPPEILTHILLLVPSPAVKLRITVWESSMMAPRDIATLRSVCYLWNDLISCVATFWCHMAYSSNVMRSFRLGSIPALSLSLERAGGLLHNVHLISATLSVFHSHAGASARIRELHCINAVGRYDGRSLSFPALETLTFAQLHSARFPFKSEIFPSLRRLVIHGDVCHTEWSSYRPFTSVIELCLVKGSWWPSSNAFLDCLSCFPNIEDLIIGEQVIKSAFPHPHTEQKERLCPKLRNLTFDHVYLPTIEEILPHLAIPDNVTIRITSDGREDVCRHAFAQHSPRIAMMSPRTGRPRLIVLGKTSAVRLDNLSWIHQYCALTSLRSARMPHISEIREFWLVGAGEDRREYDGYMRTFLGSAMGLATLVVQDCNLEICTQILQDFDHEDIHLACPMLETLHVLINGSIDYCELANKIRELAAIRTTRGSHLKTLILGDLPGHRDGSTSLLRAKLAAEFDFVEHRTYDETPRMDLPSECTEERHYFWASWHSHSIWPRSEDW